MCKALLPLVSIAALAACAGAAPRHDGERAPDLSSIAWLAGDWIGQGPDGAPAEERWSAPSDGAMVGRALDEDLRIELRDGAIHYVARPHGAGAETAFRAVEIAEGHAIFEAPEHDFPQRIEYGIQPDGSLTATISDLAGSRRLTWTFRR